MASNFAATGEETKAEQPQQQQQQRHHQWPSPRAFRRSWSTSSSTCSEGSAAGGGPKCVCAPTTHAGSFKCRLHRAASHGPSGHSHHPAPMPPQPAVSSSPTRTVEAQ